MWLWYPTRIWCGLSFSATAFTSSAVFFSRSAELYTAGASERMMRFRFPIDWLNATLAASLSPCSSERV